MTKEEDPKLNKIFPEAEIQTRQPRNLKEKFLDFYYNAVPFFNVNLAWIVMSIPVITIFPALGGLYHATLALAQDNQGDWEMVWEGFKKYWWLSVRWGLLVLFVDLILLANIWFYLNISQDWVAFALAVVVMLLIFWIAVNQFSFPLLLLQEEKKIFLAIRNAFVIVMRTPLAALKVMGLTLLIALVSFLLPPLWIFISMALICYIRNRTVINAVKKINQKDSERVASEAYQDGEEHHTGKEESVEG